MKFGSFTLDLRSVLGVAASAAGYIAINGPSIAATLPPSAQKTAGTVIGIAGLVLTFLGRAPEKA